MSGDTELNQKYRQYFTLHLHLLIWKVSKVTCIWEKRCQMVKGPRVKNHSTDYGTGTGDLLMTCGATYHPHSRQEMLKDLHGQSFWKEGWWFDWFTEWRQMAGPQAGRGEGADGTETVLHDRLESMNAELIYRLRFCGVLISLVLQLCNLACGHHW